MENVEEKNMKPLISVIFPKINERMYLVRCLNSIKRQICGETEFFLINTECPKDIIDTYRIKTIFGNTWQEGVNQALTLSQGQYIFFASGTSVFSPNLFEMLITEKKNPETAAMVSFRIWDGKDFKENHTYPLSIYNMMFEKERLNQKKIYFHNSFFSEEAFVAEYLKSFNKISEIKNAEIYETDVDLLEQISSFGEDINQFEELLKIFTNIPVGVSNYFIYKFMENLYINANGDTDILMRYILKIARYLSCEKELNYQLANRYVKQYYEKLIDCKDLTAYERLKSYLKQFEKEEEYLKVMLDTLNIDMEQYKIMKCHNLEDYLFYKDKVSNPINISAYDAEIHELKEETKFNKTRIEKMEEILQKRVDVTSVENVFQNQNSNVSKFQGPELAEFVISNYSNGKLGLKTILKSIKAWLKYKV